MAKRKRKNLTGIPLAILELLKSHPDGLDIEEIRALGGFEGQQHLDRRLRDLDPLFLIDRTRAGNRTLYRLVGERAEGEYDYEVISKTVRAKILTRDGRRCRMCGRTVDEDQIKLHIDHKIPREWGGTTSEENLWALCSACNEGKRNHFASFDPKQMQQILCYDSVHRRLAETLHANLGAWIDRDLLEFVANFDDYQTDWPKRLRELRYFNLKIDTRNRKVGRRTVSYYRLNNWLKLPENLSEAARHFEADRAKANKRKSKPNK